MIPCDEVSRYRANFPTKTEREDAVLLANMIIDATARGQDPPIVTNDRAWLLAATLRYIISKRGGSVD